MELGIGEADLVLDNADQDQSAAIFTELKKAGKAFGMPTTLLIDSNGCELGVMAGPAEWSSPDALYAIRTALGR